MATSLGSISTTSYIPPATNLITTTQVPITSNIPISTSGTIVINPNPPSPVTNPISPRVPPRIPGTISAYVIITKNNETVSALKTIDVINKQNETHLKRISRIF